MICVLLKYSLLKFNIDSLEVKVGYHEKLH